MATKKPQASKEYEILKKRSGRYAVMKKGKYVNGADKVAILVQEGLVKAALPKKVEEAAAPVAEAPKAE